MTTYIGSLADPTFCHLVHRLTRCGLAGDVVDLGHLVLDGDLHLPLDGAPARLVTDRVTTVSLPVVARLVDLAPTAPTPRLRDRARGIGIALRRYLATLPWNCVVGSSADNSNFSKMLQLGLARTYAWSTPASCLTNDPAVAADFLHGLARSGRTAIYKGPSSAKTWASAVTSADLERLTLLRTSPVLFQERIEGPDVRVHVVGEEVFGEAVHSGTVDYRTASTKSFCPQEVPEEVAAACVSLTRSMRLVLSGIDFKLSSTGRWYFLEANSAPCLQGYDRRAGGAITRALARVLQDPTPAREPALRG